jgi:peptide/nickel transport system substrate-binding protein
MGKFGRRIVGSCVAVLVLAACTGGGGTTASTSGSASPAAGGVLRVGASSFGLTDGLDPSGEYTSPGWSALWPMLRNLVSYRVAPGAEGLRIVPDLATSVPAPTADGLTYVFHLKPGIMFGPPLNRAITSKDVAYAFERINTASVAAQYSFYYVGVIKGMTGTAKKPGPISGIQTPNDTTIVFHLLQPTGDFLSRLAMPAAAPIPQEVAKCFLTAGAYGRYVISSGPYMMRGSDQLDPSSCDTMKPITGFDPSSQLTLVRNPEYRVSTDTSTGRLNDPQAIQITIDSNVSDIFDQISAGTLDTSYYDNPPHTVVQQYATDPALKGRLIASQGGLTEYFQMNLTVPPFDDIHVRKAVNLIVDKTSIQKAWGGPSLSQIATHVIPPLVLGNVPAATFDLYPTPGNAGDLSRAKAQMALSKYDTNHDGKCDGEACNDVVMISQNIPPYSEIEPILVADLAKIGITLAPREFDLGTAFNQIQHPKNQIPSQIAVPWVYDYPDAFSYDAALWWSYSISATANPNMSLVGLTAPVAAQLGVPYPSGGVPSVDGPINRCEVLVLGTARNTCWAKLERTLMSKVVPVAPLLWFAGVNVLGADVTNFEVTPEQGVALTNIAVHNDATLGS